MTKVSSIVTPYIIVQDGAKAIEFYKKAFGAQELECYEMPDGKIGHAKLQIGDSSVMLSDEFPAGQGCRMMSPAALRGTTVMLHVPVDDVDSSFEKAIQAGAKVKMAVTDTFWGDRYGQLEDPFGHLWSMSTPKEELTPEQIRERMKECFSPVS